MTYTKTQVDDMIARNLNPFRQDVVGTNTLTIVAGVSQRFVVNGLSRNSVTGPAYFTDRIDLSTGVMTATTEYDGPTYIASVGGIWTPSASSEGTAKIRVYINDTTPKLIRTFRESYKGADAEPFSKLVDWYWGAEAGYDAKNDGIYFEVEFEHNGTITSPSLSIYNTQ